MMVRNCIACARTTILVATFALMSLAVLPPTALAEPEPHASAQFESFLEDVDDPVERAAERLRTATPRMREARLERLSMRLLGASRWERRRILRREGRIMRALPDEDRARIESENEAFRDKHGILSIRDRMNLAESGEFDYSAKERKILRARIRELPIGERRALMRKIKNVRELPEGEREELHERLNEMKSLSREEREEFRQKAKRWSEMSEERRDKLRAQMKKLREMPIDERMELLERAMESEER